ncbi:hypothetical protein [Bradyrhizobium sp. th.b2]|uniref:hypothetical protein n=1 Tax=Bradyrhizobium sp. th-b2 TaxID=172088 RepID=UPI0012ECB8AC|nr:hypothetical protein [Bradyrhizobium sp. th.b2]
MLATTSPGLLRNRMLTRVAPSAFGDIANACFMPDIDDERVDHIRQQFNIDQTGELE